MRATPNGWDNWQVGDFAIYQGKTYTFPGEVVACTTDGQVVLKAIGDSEGNYSGMKHIFGPSQLTPWELDAGKGSPFLVIDPELELVAQVRAFCNKHPEKHPLGLAQLHALLNAVDNGNPDKVAKVFVNHGNNGAGAIEAEPDLFTTQDGNLIRNDRPKADPVEGAFRAAEQL